MSVRVGSLFSGYSGLEMGLTQVIDCESAWFSEVDPAASKVLAHHWPDVPNHGDVTRIDWAAVEPIDILTGGVPCQDVSHAGKRAGMRAGTRTGLWSAMREAIAELRPPLAVFENVRGILSAGADSDLEPCPGCVGDPDDGTVLRALGRVLGDLASLGYDARWYGLRAADVGAAHNRFRVFVFAERGARSGEEQRWLCESERPPADPGLTLLGTPTAQLAINGGSRHPDKRRAGGHGPTVADEVEHLLPTPCASEVGGTRDLDHRVASGSQLELSDVVRLLPTPTARDHKGPNQRGDETCLTGALLPTPDAACASGGHLSRGGARRGELLLPGAVRSLLPTPRTSDANGAGAHGDGGPDLRTALLPTPTAMDSRASGGRVGGSGVTLTDATVREARPWAQYEAAIRRHEYALGRPAPAPTEPGRTGPRLSPAFVEWLMMLPDGHVTDPRISLSRNEQLRMLGNGVVPPQCAAAFRQYLTDEAAEAAS